MSETNVAFGFSASSQAYTNVVPYNFEEFRAEDAQPDNKLVKKMPVSYLQELCGRKRVTPIYELKASEGQVHEPTFVYVVTIEDLSGLGQGKNKKIAKHYAARDALNRIVENERFIEWQLGGKTREEAFDHLNEALIDLDTLPGAPPEGVRPAAIPAEEVGDSAVALLDEGLDALGAPNAIGRLYELHSQRKWPSPQYDLTEESGLPHDKVFVIKVTLGNFERIGTARTKRLAKRYAAEAMLKFLTEAGLEKMDKDLVLEDCEENAEEEISDNIAVPDGDLDVDLSNLAKQQISIENADSSQFSFDLNGFGGSQNQAVTVADAKPSTQTVKQPDDIFWDRLSKIDGDDKPCGAHKKFLQEIAEHRGWTVSYSNLDRKSKDGKFQCIVSFDVDEKQSCFGSGETAEEAEMGSALQALELLKLLIMEIPTK